MDRWTRFIQMFEIALRTKADSCLNIQDYDMLIYPPGAVFDKRIMEVEQDNASNHEGGIVEVCVEAAVFAHAGKHLSEDSSAAEA